MIGERRKKRTGKTEKNRQNDFMSHHVSEKTEGEGKESVQNGR